MKRFYLTLSAILLSLATFALPGISGTTTICTGGSTSLSDSTTGGTWTSTNSAVATIGSISGVVTGVGAGTTMITYHVSSSYVTTVITVNPAPSAISGPSSVCSGSTITLTDVTGGGTWSSSNTIIATVGMATGVVTGVSSGTVNIVYTIATGCTATHSVSVTYVSSISGPSAICGSGSITLTDSASGGAWSSSNVAIASVGSGGVVTGISSGTTNITYTVASCYAVHMVTITTGVAAITGASTVCSGSTITLSDVTTGGSWSSGNPLIANVGSATGVVTGVSGGVATISYTAGACYSIHTVTVTYVASVSGLSTVCSGSSISLTDSTTGGGWSSSNTGVATVGSTGMVTGVSAGVTNITYMITVGSCYSVHAVTVSPGVTAITGSSTVCVGSNITLSDATGGGIWSSSSPTVASAGSATGLITGVAAGVATISYTVGGCYATHSVTVTAGSGSITGGSSVCIGSTLSLTGSGGGTWSSSNTSIATVGSTGIVTGVSSGSVSIFYTVSGCAVSHAVTVTSGLPSISGPSVVCTGSSITLTDSITGGTWASSATGVATVSSGGVVSGISAGVTTITYSVSGCFALHSVTVNPLPSAITGASSVCVGSTITLADLSAGGTWSSSNTAIATVGISTGVVSGIASGAVNISYTVGGCTSVHSLTVTASTLSITGGSTVCIGSTITLSCGTGGGTWSSGNTAIETVGATTGVVTGVSAGTTNIFYTVTGCAAYHSVTVISALPAISGPSGMCVGSSITLTDSISGGAWSSSSTGIATVGTTGVVTGISAGVATITYATSGCTSYHAVTISPVPATISGASTDCIGSTITLTDATTGGIWSSGNIYIATVGSATGVVTGISAGATGISYTAGGCSVYHNVTITSGTTSISGASSLCLGSTTTLTAAGGGTWSSGNTAIATVGISTGIVTGVSAGTVNIYYNISGCSSVHAITITSGSTISGASSVCSGSTISLTDSSSSGTWSSGSTGIATVSSGGVVTGISTGVTTITYSLSGCSAYHTVSVAAAPAAISGATGECIGSTTTLSDATAGGTWSSGTTAIATVNSAGVVTGVSAGTTGIYYTVGGCAAYVAFTVSPVPVSITGATSVCSGSSIVLSDGTAGGTWSSSSTAIATVSSTSGIVTGVSAGVTNIYYSIGSCATYHTVTVVPGPAAIGGSASVCVGHTETLTDATAGGIWSSGSPTIASISSTSGIVTGSASGVASITYLLTTGCSAHISLTVNPNPTVSAISGSTSLSMGFTTSLSDATTGGVWSSSNTSIATVGSATGVVTGVSSGTVNILYTVTNSYGCSAYAIHSITVGPTPPNSNLGVSNIGSVANVTMMPNPNKGEFTLQGAFGNGDEEVVAEVTNMLGQVVYQNSLTTNNGTINSQISLGGSLANGIYMLNLRSGDQRQVIRFVIEK